MADITGTSGFDSLTGTDGADHILGLGQNDSLYGLEGDDWLEGGSGNDSLHDGAGDDLAEGGEGDDWFDNSDGSDTLHGGGGDDRFVATRGSGQSGLVLMTGGLGRDQFEIRSIGSASFVIDAGDGDDLIVIDTYRGDHVLTLGSGVDTVAVNGPLFFGDFLTTTITDFAAGADGDRLDFSTFFALNLAGWDGNQNPFALGYVRLVQSGTDVLIEIDQDGGGNSYSYVEYLRLANVDSASLTFHNLDGFPADGSIPAGLILNGTAAADTIVGAAGNDTISGFGQDDYLYGGSGADTIRGGDGQDNLFGEGGNDLIEGGAGSDRLTDGHGDDIVRGGADSDSFYSQDRGNDLLEGEGGNDYFDVRRGLDYRVTIDGGDGDDYIVIAAYGAANVFTVIGGAGNETINFFSMAGTAQISLGAGSDEISLAWLHDSLLFSGHIIVSDFATGAGGDRLDYDSWLASIFTWDQATNPFESGHLRLVQSGADTLLQADRDGGGNTMRTIVTFTGREVAAFTPYNLDGFASDGSAPVGVTLIGTAAIERLTGTAGADRIEGRGGADTLEGLGGSDVIIGGDQNDSIEGGTGDDRLEGAGGNDYINGGAGADEVYGGEGHDTIYVNEGADTVRAGGGNDSVYVQTSPPVGGTIAVYGDSGADSFTFNHSAGGTFIVADGGADSDTIRIGDLHGTATVTLGSGADRVILWGNAGANGQPGDVRITDFEIGEGGDLIDLAGSLGQLLLNWDQSNPFYTGHVRLVQLGADTLLQIDRDAGGSDHDFVTTLTLENVAAGTLTAANVGFVRDLVVGSGGFATLQAAVDAAKDGDTIVILAGTYVGQVNIDKDVTIVGSNQGVDGSAERGAEAVIDGLVTISAAGVTIDGVKFVGRGPTPLGGTSAVAVRADDFTVMNSIFDAMSAADRAINTETGVSGLQISTNLVQGYASGILIGQGVSGAVRDNRFQGDTGLFTPLVFLESLSSQTLIADNVFSGLDNGAIFLAPSGPDPVDLNNYVTGNIFTNIGVPQPVSIAPTSGSPRVVGTDHGERFDGAGAVPGLAGSTLAFSFDGRGGDDRIYGAAQGDILSGGAGNDELFGNGGNDRLDGGADADRMTGGTGNDLYFVDSAGDIVTELAGEGMDEVRTSLATAGLAAYAHVENLTGTSATGQSLTGNAGNNVVTGGSGNDVLRLYDGGVDTANGGAGNDTLFFIGSLTSADVVNGGDGVDTLVIQGPYGSLALSANITRIENVSILGGNNTNFGEPGTNRYDYVLTTNDANFAAGVQARINGAALLAGEDFTFDGSAETDAKYVVYGGKGRDTLTGGLGNDIFFYAEERFASGDVVNGGSGYDGMFLRGNYTIDFTAPGYTGLFTSIENLTLTSATDERYARGGGTEFDYNLTLSDAIVKPGEQLTISGTLLTASETMILDASQEADGLLRLFGGKANDSLKGGGQADLLHGNLGADTLAGNGGADAFRYQEVAESNALTMDRILDFTPGTDRIELDRIDANTLVGGDQGFAWIGSNAFSGVAGQLRAHQQGGTWFVEGDVNGDSVADLVIALTLQGPTPLGAGDFLL